MKKYMIRIGSKDFSPILVNRGECCLNCDVEMKDCCWQCHDFEEYDGEYVALKKVRHKDETKLWMKIWQNIKKCFEPIESDTPF